MRQNFKSRILSKRLEVWLDIKVGIDTQDVTICQCVKRVRTECPE